MCATVCVCVHLCACVCLWEVVTCKWVTKIYKAELGRNKGRSRPDRREDGMEEPKNLSNRESSVSRKVRVELRIGTSWKAIEYGES